VVYERTRREHNREGGRRVRVRKRELDAMNIRALLDVLKAAGESARGCVERDDLIRRVLTSSRVDVVAETTVEVSRSELDAMSLGAVARLAKRAGVVIDGALERPDVVALLEQSGRVLIVDGATEEAPAVAVAVETTSPVPAAAADLLDVYEDADLPPPPPVAAAGGAPDAAETSV
jgi:hypothetical protein